MTVLTILRLTVFGVVAFAAAVAVGTWAIQTRRLNPFGRLGQLIRRAGDPLLDPIEGWQLRRGGNPQHAVWWLLGGSLVGGILLVTLADWVVREMAAVLSAASAGPRGVLRLMVYYAGRLVILALIIRVVASWFGAGRYNRWIGWTYALTDWIIRPLRQVVPPIGMVDITPLVAWLLLEVLLATVLSIL